MSALEPAGARAAGTLWVVSGANRALEDAKMSCRWLVSRSLSRGRDQGAWYGGLKGAGSRHDGLNGDGAGRPRSESAAVEADSMR